MKVTVLILDDGAVSVWTDPVLAMKYAAALDDRSVQSLIEDVEVQDYTPSPTERTDDA